MAAMLEATGPFHEGELTLQRATGEREIGARNGRIIDDRMVPEAVLFIARQELAVIATADGEGRPWCSALLGQPGSFTAPEPTRVELARTAGRPDDPLWHNIREDPRVGTLFIEVGSRRRYRVNGHVLDPDGDPLAVEVREAFPNCPKYIARRHLVVGPPRSDAADAAGGAELGEAERQIIDGADACFVATANPAGHLDASHRGGRPGFIELRGSSLWIPDYRGNSMFNTLGNLAINPAAGLLFIDFDGRQTLQLTGAAALDLDADDPAGVTGGTRRAWTFTPTMWRRAPLAAKVRAELLDLSPSNP
jgi:predicted pyridoxine 5'-phosphate oxidase superfamily flavin-nucleotide-binding protein